MQEMHIHKKHMKNSREKNFLDPEGTKFLLSHLLRALDHDYIIALKWIDHFLIYRHRDSVTHAII